MKWYVFLGWLYAIGGWFGALFLLIAAVVLGSFTMVLFFVLAFVQALAITMLCRRAR